MQNLLPRAEKKLQAIMNAEKARIFVIDKENETLYRYGADGKRENFVLNTGIVGSTITIGKPEHTANAYSDPLFNRLADIETSMPLITWPLKNLNNENEVIGAFQVMNVRGIRGLVHTSKPKLNQLETEMLDFFAKQLAQAVTNNMIYDGLELEGNQTNILELQRAMTRALTRKLTPSILAIRDDNAQPSEKINNTNSLEKI